MNILLSVNNLGLGGVTTYVINLARSLAKDHKVVIFDHYPYASDYRSVAFQSEVVLIESTLSNPLIDAINWRIAGILKRLKISDSYWESTRKRYFNKILRKYDIQLITSFDKYSDAIVVDAVGSTLPLVLSIHGSYDISDYQSVSQDEILKYNRVFSTAKGIIYKTDSNIRILKEYDNLDNLIIVKKVYHAFVSEPPHFSIQMLRKKMNIPKGAFVFGMIARGVPEKGWKEAILAFLQVRKEIERDIHFVVIGGSDYLDSLKNEFSGEKNLHYTGSVYTANSANQEEPSAIDWVNMLDVGVLPTYTPTENYSFSVLEYMFCRKPTIASDHGEISVTLDAGGEKAGMLITKIDGKPDVNGFKEAMKLYVYNSVLYERHKKLTVKALKKFSSEKAVSDYEEVFNLVLRKTSAH